MTWVIGDHLAAPGSQELTVHKGQQVEVLDVKTPSPDWCLVRMPTSGSVDSPPEGLVPLSVLKQPPGVRTSPSRKNSNDPETGRWKFSCCCFHVPFGWPTKEESSLALLFRQLVNTVHMEYYLFLNTVFGSWTVNVLGRIEKLRIQDLENVRIVINIRFRLGW